MRSAPTDAERRLWQILRGKRFAGYKFRRQVPIDHYIVDFVCLSRRLIVEADGGQHAGASRDVRRDAYLAAQGFLVLRLWNHDILTDEEAIGAAIHAALTAPLPQPLSRRGERGLGAPNGS